MSASNNKKYLVVVESPAKAKTIEKYLGKDYTVLASYGHVRDLPARKGSVIPDQNFRMTYVPIEKNARHIEAIAKALKKSDVLMLATDPDREGEAISWHIYELMQARGLIQDKEVQRIVFNEITKSAIHEAAAHPRQISMELVNAQQARRALDYLVGFILSPLLWKKIRRGLSAGRVQSPALRLIVEREEEIERFKAQEYWSITAKCQHLAMPFSARLTYYQGEKLANMAIENDAQATAMQQVLLQRAQGQLEVIAVDKKMRKRQPAAPFITSTLQQEAARKLGFTARKTMMLAQQLYEGIDIGTGTVGLITYMRTDSVNISQEAIKEMREYISAQYGEAYCPKNARFYQTKSKNAQEAHEAIRPTSILRQPGKLQALSNDQRKLYELIWKRTLASQMTDALFDTVAIDFTAGPREDKAHWFRANGKTMKFAGFLTLYEEGRDDPKDKDEDKDGLTLPPLEVGEKVVLDDIEKEQHFTEPPSRYSEASLVKALEEFDIGRPSTYATIIYTLQQREYVIVDKKRFIPTDVGRIVSRFLTEYFTQYVDYKFTAQLEESLDEIARGEKIWTPVLADFWSPFIKKVEEIDAQVQRKDVTTELLSELCPECQKPLAIQLGKRGRFIGCTGYPECTYTQALEEKSEDRAPIEIVEGRTCPACQHELQIKTGRYGRFIGCSQYPTCKHMEPLEKPEDTGVTCPSCEKATILKRKSRKGKIFYSCSRYPKCKYALWDEPVKKECPKCHGPILTVKVTKKFGTQEICPQTGCGYKHTLEE